ncbi:hypothetical protein B0H17DRAFT_1135576 [Mycena rosella]|uniref:Uncharacterized protein n=1 Tax=Mycena rosella TaxID=1033263 RepID=A0AAD7GHS4_MYCRO|nr:hypothetical protein B0H17DRAFT_1135576 [Mycena rosella]
MTIEMGCHAKHLTNAERASAKPEDSEIEHFSLIPLPNNHPLFCEALRKADALDESDLGRWKAEPLFVDDDDTSNPHSDQYLHFTQSLASVLHGVWLHDQNQRDAKHRNEFKTNGKAAMAVLRPEVVDFLSGWERHGVRGGAGGGRGGRGSIGGGGGDRTGHLSSMLPSTARVEKEDIEMLNFPTKL